MPRFPFRLDGVRSLADNAFAQCGAAFVPKAGMAMRLRDERVPRVSAVTAGAALALLAVAAAAAPPAKGPRTSLTGSRTVLSRLDFKGGSRLADRAVGPEQRLDDRRLSDERYLRHEKAMLRRERKVRESIEAEERERERTERLRPGINTRREHERSGKAFDLLFR